MLPETFLVVGSISIVVFGILALIPRKIIEKIFGKYTKKITKKTIGTGLGFGIGMVVAYFIIMLGG